MPRFEKGSKEAKEYMASIRKQKGKGLQSSLNFQGQKIDN